MHADEVGVDAELVGRLVAVQFPSWAGLPIAPVLPRGTDNALFRLGDRMVVRLPCRARTTETLEKERAWLPRLAPLLPLDVPIPLADGSPQDEFPFAWCVYRWLEGETLARRPPTDQAQLARDLAGFLDVLRRIDPAAGPPPGEHNFGRGEPLARRDAPTRAAIAALAQVLDSAAVTDAWCAALRAPDWPGPPVWIHGDLDGRNLLGQDGRLSGVIDFGALGVGDPACDVMVAWKVLDPPARRLFREALDVDDATWTRARGWALSQAVVALSYYTPKTNAELVREARGWLDAVLSDVEP